MSVKIYKGKSPSTKQDPINITILEAYSPEIIEFDTKEEFIDYLTEHKEEMDAMTTVKLNQKYKINGYRITKLNKEISLKKIKSSTITIDENTLTDLVRKLDNIIVLLNSGP